MKKINGILVILLFLILIYTRFVNLSWGLPYPFHPDERNMAVALQQLNCKEFSNLKECLNPHFFAYGQFPLYLGLVLIQIFHLFTRQIGNPIAFAEATMALRIISAVSSVFTVWVGVKIVQHLFRHPEQRRESRTKSVKSASLDSSHSLGMTLAVFLLFIFSPGLIQFAHFGTTESLLMLLYSAIIYVSLLFLGKKILNSKFLILNSLLCGLAVATKVSSMIFLGVPIAAVILNLIQDLSKKMPKRVRHDRWRYIFDNARTVILFMVLTAGVAIIFSPHNLISRGDFLAAFRYESSVGLGQYIPFYTRQFFQTAPILFPLEHIFPYALGWPVFILSIGGFLFLPWDKKTNLLRFALLIYSLPTAFIFTKWTRFMAPIFPLMIVFACLFMWDIWSKVRILVKRYKSIYRVVYDRIIALAGILMFLSVLPGVAYLSVYQKPDVRFQASEWIYQNIPANSYILSETANVVDIPIPVQSSRVKVQNYNIISFDFYNLDENPLLLPQLQEHLSKADYIFVPSRRIFVNHTCVIPFPVSASEEKQSRDGSAVSSATPRNDERCQQLKQKYPLLNEYYEKLFSGDLGFEEVAEFNSFPRLPGRNEKQQSDEDAEETWTVFDHPVIRVYKKI